MEKFISCDWGTTSFRMRVVNSSDLSILAARETGQGIAATHTLWAAQPLQGSDRLHFYQTVLLKAIQHIERELDMSLDEVPLVISGMASSSLGMLELPYKEFPFLTNGSDLRVETLGASAGFKHDVLLISGACTRIDVMRGEETQLAGCEAGGGRDSGNSEQGGEHIYIFPGTHSKHVLVREGRAVSLKTFMTGEFFELLSTKSILAGDVGEPGAGEWGGDRLSRFEEGVRSGVDNNLLHGSFLVRTNRLLRSMSKEDNYYYLSGLLIGAELKELAGIGVPLTIVGSGLQQEYYKAALRQLGMREVRLQDAGEAVLRGQRRIAGW